MKHVNDLNPQQTQNPHIEILNARRHAKLKFTGCRGCRNCCCNGSTYLTAPVLLFDLFDTAKLFPVVFSQSGKEIGLNLFYTLRRKVPCPYLDTAKEQCKVYDSIRPMACSSYPFNIINTNAEPGSSPVSYGIVFDNRCGGLTDSDDAEGFPVVNPDGTLADFIKENFIPAASLDRFQANHDRTNRFIQLVKEFELLTEKSITITPRRERNEKPMEQEFSIRALIIDTDRLASLTETRVMTLHREGFFNAIYTHLNSLTNFTKLYETLQGNYQPPVDLLNFRFQ